MSIGDRLFNLLIRHYEDPESRAIVMKWFFRISLIMIVMGYIILFYLLFSKHGLLERIQLL